MISREWVSLALAAALLVFTQSSHVAAKGEEYVGGQAHSEVVKLTKETFQTALDDAANPIWFLKFHAYWCGHCKRLAPVLEVAAPQTAGRMAIGTIECTEEKGLCNDFKVRGYPTLKFAIDGEIYDYPGGRTEADIVSFAERLNRPFIKLVDSHEQAMEHTNKETDGHGVSFVCHDPKASKEGSGSLEKLALSSKIVQVCSQVARKQMADAYFTLLKPGAEGVGSIQSLEAGSDGFVCRLEANVPPRCLQGTIDTTTTIEFVRINNVATVSELGPQNFHRIGRNGRPLVIGVVDSSNDSALDKMKEQLAEFALNGRSDEREKYYYGWMDGPKWTKFLTQFNIEPDQLPQIFVLDVPEKIFWQAIEYKEKPLEQFMTAVADGTIPSQQSAGVRGAHVMHRIANFFVDHWLAVLLALFAVMVGAVVALLPSGGEQSETDGSLTGRSKKDQ